MTIIEKLENDDAHWTYCNVCWWSDDFSQCGGTKQSPIDIPCKCHTTAKNNDILINYKNTESVIVNNGHTIQIDYNEGGSIEYENKTYSLKQFHFHLPSEHTIEETRHDMEMHLVHKKGNELLVLAVFIDISKKCEQSNSISFFNELFKGLPSKNCSTNNKYKFNIFDILPDNLSHYLYNGSLTTPPCSEIVKWVVLEQPIYISKSSYCNFFNIYNNNSRPLQPLNDRTICYIKK
jgi:carbonic anhydrase